MQSLSEAKTLGGIGAILVVLGLAPSVGFVLAIAGWVLILVAVDRISKAVNDRTIFNNVLMAVILAIVGSIVAGLLLGFGVFFAILGGEMGPGAPADPFAFFSQLLGVVVVGLVAFWLVMIFSARYLRRGYDAISSSLNVPMFRTAGKLYFYGALLSIILVGLILILIAEILQIVAFFSIPESPPQPFQPTATTSF
ncbi:MAG: DUF996 domain-containing protein [Thaumarchaeota archaeon]|nr:DUF996 domain-containing protein [Candidatus Calditenuaceae archaeon]MDW8042470.1 DUF996 domain-containing protein [Nitrososphaerota archaeon]